MQNLCRRGFGNRPAATRTVDWCLVWDRRGVWPSGRDESAYLVRQLESWEAAGGGVWVDPDGGLEDDFDGMGVASWNGGAWNDDGA